MSIALLTSAINGLLNSESIGYQVAGSGSVILIVMQVRHIYTKNNEKGAYFLITFYKVLLGHFVWQHRRFSRVSIHLFGSCI